jgi:glycyl-tRNA synthetase beta chain
LELETQDSKLETGSSVVVEEQSSIINRQSPITLPLLLEVGCEEIPARFLRDAEKGLGERVQAALREARLLPKAAVGAIRESPLRTYSTPRRLVIHVPALLDRQPDRVEEILGPPVKVAVDAEGKYTRAAESFAQRNSARLEDLIRTTTPRGKYLVLRKTTQGRCAQEILPEILPATILGLSFPKSMYWMEKSDPRFVRPIRWVLAILGEGKQAKTVHFEILGVKSGDFTFGHRAKSRKPQRVTGFKDYTRKLAQAHVEIDSAHRMERVIQEAQALVEKASLKLVKDEWLVHWIVNSTEWPQSMLGGFDERFLHLPREILITVMRDHQKYLAVEVGPSAARPDGHAQLAPHFVAVLNMDSDEKGLIRQGHERVLAARFSDAEFFWKTDLKTTLFERIPLLDGITYQAGLGTYAEKVSRMRTIASWLCERLEACPVAFVPWHYGGSPSGLSKQPVKVRFTDEHTRNILRAVDLCKCDLTTQMVQEFPELQGIVGGLYVGAQPLPEWPGVAEAIYDHYRPASAEDTCPRSIVGAVVSLVDKLDSVVAGFAVGHIPTGSSDPFALRRQSNGIIKVILEFEFPISLSLIVGQALETLDITWRRPSEEVFRQVLEFLADRLRYHLEAVCSFRYDTVRAVLAAGSDVPYEAFLRAQALHNLRGSENLEALCVAAKRIKNILEKSASQSDWIPGEVDASLLTEDAERELHGAYLAVDRETQALVRAGDYQRALEAISKLRPFVDTFFDKVLVMAEDKAVRESRLRLLGKLDRMFSGIAQFSEIAAEVETK